MKRATRTAPRHTRPSMTEVVSGIWVRKVPPSNFWNIERHPSVGYTGGSGPLYIEAPTSVVPALLALLGQDPAVPIDSDVSLETRVIGASDISAPLVWATKSGNRLRLFQNRQSPSAVRHPAWRAERGFPSAPDSVASTAEAAAYITDGLRVYVVRTDTGDYYAGFLVGEYPADWPDNSELRSLFTEPGGVKFFTEGLYLNLEDAETPFRAEPGATTALQGSVLDPVTEPGAELPPSATKTFPYASPEVAAAVDTIAMDLAMDWAAETFPDAQIRRMPHNNPGYDILVIQNGAPTRYIEVKGTMTSTPRFYMSENERRFSVENAGSYTLIVFFRIDVASETAECRVREGAIDADELTVLQWQGRLAAD